MGLYARKGILEAWLLDLTREAVSVNRDPSPDGYKNVVLLRRGDRVGAAAFPDIDLEAAELLG
jgi:Uma2 family endonuclease